MILQRPTDTGRGSSAKRLCTGAGLLRTSLDVPTIKSQAAPAWADFEGERATGESTLRLLMSDYVLRIRLWLDGRCFFEQDCHERSPVRDSA